MSKKQNEHTLIKNYIYIIAKSTIYWIFSKL